ncbi:hypothetical protein PSECIP111951_01674 [Pseudoalteromonas holothuriae]|uniref:Uncharacterized protein n=1 Tax=Pseudoalteromonas holothuriae TaxID=2963714 RepID=A0ABM9GH89_9GAMM|nr:hypothetical protein [Pseudoalteromonas sp. CIP111951]CAH9057468.1 hypothetical protein PSECIP111951_01674 [Pseudoalteromonas sp. CIP111951]
MKKRYLVLGVCLAGLLFWSLLDNEELGSNSKGVYEKPLIDSDLTDVAKSVAPLPKPQKHTVHAMVQMSGQLSEAAEHVATQYQQALKYPPYSQPLSANDDDRLRPNYFYPVSSVIADQSEPLTIKLSKYRYVYPEDIVVEISGPDVKNVELKLVDIDNQQEYASTRLLTHPYEARFKGSKQLPRNLQLIASAQLERKEVPIIAQFQYMQPSAKVVSISDVYPNNDNMVVDVRLEVINPGVYRLRANLFAGDLPLAHLVSKEKLSRGTQTIKLQAHWSVLQPTISNMLLSGFVIERMSPSPDEPNSYGSSDIKLYEIHDFPYDSLQQLPYQASSKELQSLEFLRQLANSGQL